MTGGVIVDTNILQYGVSRSLKLEVEDLLNQVRMHRPNLRISSFTKFEVYRGLNKPKIEPTRKLVRSFKPISVDDDTFRIAAVLYSCYQNHTATKSKNKQADDGDIVIAATAIRHNTPILTANGNDFPRPFFQECSPRLTLTKPDKGEIVVQLLAPDIRVFNMAMREYLL